MPRTYYNELDRGCVSNTTGGGTGPRNRASATPDHSVIATDQFFCLKDPLQSPKLPLRCAGFRDIISLPIGWKRTYGEIHSGEPLMQIFGKVRSLYRGAP